MTNTPPAPGSPGAPALPPIIGLLPGLAPLAQLIPNPAIAILAQILLTYGPSTYAAFATLFYNPKATIEDVLGVIKEIDAESYDKFMAEAEAIAGPA